MWKPKIVSSNDKPKDQHISVQPSSEGKPWFSAELIRDGEAVKDIFISDYAMIPVMEMARICAGIAESMR